ncbi:hypothetical protein CEXT_87331 [Caerostris extrusa]|uniref:Uncharacterized protein n=1 Tax=Caerostris extrusa TaxID=172846 RepID=A0AAV4WL14_CAEEX|nr:hypothetical protein CEXT_87331 [Caerostris extrusa]
MASVVCSIHCDTACLWELCHAKFGKREARLTCSRVVQNWSFFPRRAPERKGSVVVVQSCASYRSSRGLIPTSPI